MQNTQRFDRGAFAVLAAITGLSLIVGAGCNRKISITNPAEYQRARALISREVPEDALTVLPEKIPATARDTRLWTEILPGEFGDTLLLLCRFTPKEASRIAQEGRERAWFTQVGLGYGNKHLHYLPMFSWVISGKPERIRQHPTGNFEVMLLFETKDGMECNGINAGLLVDSAAGTVIWWVYHRNSLFN